jgi:hypothetical protein
MLNAEISGKETDILVESPHGAIVVEIKTVSKLSERVFDLGIRQLRSVMGELRGAKGLFVTPGALPESIVERVGPGGLLSPNIGVARWRSTADDKQLHRVVHALIDVPGDPPNTRN